MVYSNIMALTDNPQYQQASSKATQLENRAAMTSSAATVLPDMLRKAVSERFQGSPLVKQREEALQNFLTAVPTARSEMAELVNKPAEEGGAILSPTQQQQIIAGRRAAATVPLASLNDLLRAEFGGIEDIVGAGTRAYQARAQLEQQQAESARQQSNTLLDNLFRQAGLDLEYAKLAQSTGKRSESEKKDLRNIETALASSQTALDKIEQARNLLRSGEDLSGGALGGFWRNIRQRTGIAAPSAQSNQLEGLFASINTALFGEAGKAFTESERALLEGKIPDLRVQEDVNMARLDALEQEIRSRQNELIYQAEGI